MRCFSLFEMLFKTKCMQHSAYASTSHFGISAIWNCPDVTFPHFEQSVAFLCEKCKPLVFLRKYLGGEKLIYREGTLVFALECITSFEHSCTS